MSDEAGTPALEHAWKWFELHAAQRMQTFNFFLVAVAFLVAAYATLLEHYRWPALFVAIVGAWISFWFTRLDNRTRQLVEAGESALEVCQASLATTVDIPALNFVRDVKKPISGAYTYRVVITVIEWTMVIVFLVAAAYAGYLNL